MDERVLVPVVLCGGILALASCGAEPLPCTAIGASDGLSVTVAGGPAAVTRGVDVAICTDAGCSTVTDVVLTPGSTSASETCTPDGSCSATLIPDGTLGGFAPVDLPEGEIDAEVTLHRVDGTSSVHTTTVVPEIVYPNGKRCGGAAVQGALVLDDGGLRGG